MKIMEITERDRDLYMPHIADGELFTINGVNDNQPMRLQVLPATDKPQIVEEKTQCQK